jgi:hypothetical protein
MAHQPLDHTDLQVALSGETWPKGPHDVALPLICVPLPDCIAAQLGTVDDSIVGTLKDRRYDHAPVSIEDPPGWGIVSRAVLEEHSQQRTPVATLDLLDPSIALFKMRTCYVALIELFDALSRVPAMLCCKDGKTFTLDGTEYDGEIYGLVTISDLNHREVRRACYELLSEVEVHLANLVRLDTPDPWEWIDRMSSEEDRARIVGHWTLLRRNEIDTEPIALLSLTQLLALAGKSPWIRERLAYRSGNAMNKAFHGLHDFRNRIMHPVRPLVSRITDVDRWASVIHELQGLLDMRSGPARPMPVEAR